jgi:hypothetical protein
MWGHTQGFVEKPPALAQGRGEAWAPLRAASAHERVEGAVRQ